MAYRVLMFTGLRYGELRSVTLAQVRLSDRVPHIALRAADEKARHGAQVPLPASLAGMPVGYIAERRRRLVGLPGASDADSVSVFPGALDNAALFDLPGSMIRVFDADLTAAEIEKTDPQGRTLDIHALRHSFCTIVGRSGINMQTAQRLMRHATPAMTARYTHLTLTDLDGAMATLPALPGPQHEVVAVVENAGDPRPTQRPTPARISEQKGALSCTSDGAYVGGFHEGRNNENPRVPEGFRSSEDGSGGRDRTADTRIMIPLLYQLSYAAISVWLFYHIVQSLSNFDIAAQETLLPRNRSLRADLRR